MAVPVVAALQVASALTSVVSSLAGFFGARRGASAAEREGRRLAADAIDRGEFEADRYARWLAQTMGTQRASLAAQGVDINQGSAKDIRDETETVGNADIAMIRQNAAREAYGLRRGGRSQAAQFRAGSYSYLANAFTAATSGETWNAFRGLRAGAKARSLGSGAGGMGAPMADFSYGPQYGPPTGF